MHNIRRFPTLLFLATALGGCTGLSTVPSFSAPEYSADDVYKIGNVVTATVVLSRLAWLPGDGDAKAVGAVIGGAAAASKIRAGNINALGQIAGGALGASIGSAIGKELSRTQALELIVRLDDGRIKSLVQPWESNHPLPPGARVALTVDPAKKVRAIPLAP